MREKEKTTGGKCFVQEHNKLIQPGPEHTPLDPESSALTIRPLDLLSTNYSTCLLMFIYISAIHPWRSRGK